MSDETVNQESEAAMSEGNSASEPVSAEEHFLPESYREDPMLKDFKSMDDLVKSFKSAQSMIGNSIRIPGEDASQELRDEFYEKLQKVDGVAKLPNLENKEEVDAFLGKLGINKPESASQYTFDIDGPAKEVLQNFAHKNGLTQEQATAVMEFQSSLYEQEMQSMQSMGAETLKKEWGSDMDNRIKGAEVVEKKLFEKYPEAMEALANSPHIHNPAIVAAFSELATMTTEEGTLKYDSAPKYGMTADKARQVIEEVRGNKDHEYWKPTTALNKSIKERINLAYQVLGQSE